MWRLFIFLVPLCNQYVYFKQNDASVMIKIHAVLTGYFKLDGGAMFGVVPKRLWEKLNPPDEKNLCTWSMRCLLIEHGDRRILIDTGMGDKQDEKFRFFFEPHGKETLTTSLAELGYTHDDITDVFLTHLHFDHCGGAVKRTPEGQLLPAFPNAVYWSNRRHWDWACHPNPREAASFLKENFLPLQEAGVLHFIEEGAPGEAVHWMENIDIRFFEGHTEAMMVPFISLDDISVVFSADTMPSAYHIGAPYVMAYDVRPLESMKERAFILDWLYQHKGVLFFEHDPHRAAARITKDERGKYSYEDVLI